MVASFLVCLSEESELLVFSLCSLSTTHIPGLPALLPPGSSIRPEELDCAGGERGQVQVVVMTQRSLLQWSEGSWSCQPHSLELSSLSQLSFAHQTNKGWQAAGLSSHGGKNPELFILRRDSSLTRGLPEEIRQHPFLSCKLDCSGSVVSLASHSKVFLLSATTGDILLSREVSQVSGVEWCCNSNLLLISASDGSLIFTSRTLGKSFSFSTQNTWKCMFYLFNCIFEL